MTWPTAAFVLTSGVLAGVINTIVGSGTLVTFPVLLASGYPPVLANMSNTVGLVAGNFSGAYGYRHELRGQLHRVARFGAVALVGAVIGAFGLVVLPPAAFDAVVPALVLIATLLVVAQPWLKRRLGERTEKAAAGGGPALWAGIFVAGVYGGYFGAAAGVILLALFGLLLNENIQRLNGIKNVCIGLVNAAAAVVFVIIAPIAWLPAALLMVGSFIGGRLGARTARRMPPAVLRGCVVTVGLTATALLILRRWA
ncbi:sulfite exporter TauE/SafE family protein [Streptomyces sp. NPDC057654]|uniref:sulfite exporter TauE/SafE family protein n=1 Tax=Streptomyces sp. NPDC057654 TaxID=3346196 RepID=UPI00368A5CD8